MGGNRQGQINGWKYGKNSMRLFGIEECEQLEVDVQDILERYIPKWRWQGPMGWVCMYVQRDKK